MRPMKLHRYYIVSIVIFMLAAMSFSTSSPVLMDNTFETKVQISLEEENKSKTKVDENLIAGASDLYLKETKAYAGFELEIPLVNQLYLNTIFKPPKFS